MSRYVTYRGQRQRDPICRLRVVTADGTAYHVLKLADPETAEDRAARSAALFTEAGRRP